MAAARRHHPPILPRRPHRCFRRRPNGAAVQRETRRHSGLGWVCKVHICARGASQDMYGRNMSRLFGTMYIVILGSSGAWLRN